MCAWSEREREDIRNKFHFQAISIHFQSRSANYCEVLSLTITEHVACGGCGEFEKLFEKS